MTETVPEIFVKETFSGVVENAYGEKLSTPVKFAGSFDAFKNVAGVREKNEYPSDDEIVSFVNNKRKANARQKSMTEALEAAGISKPDPNDPKVVLARMIRDVEKLDIPQEQKDMMKAVLTQKQAA